MTEELERFHQVCRDLECGSLRVAEKVDGQWRVNSWVKEVILSGFRLGKLADMSQGCFSFCDKDTVPARSFSVEDEDSSGWKHCTYGCISCKICDNDAACICEYWCLCR